MKLNACINSGILLTFLNSMVAVAQVAEDVEGSSDIGFLGRFPGSFISAQSTSEYESFNFPLTLNSWENRKEIKRLKVAGERTVRIYDISPSVETSVLKVYRSLEQKLEELGFKTYISCNGQESECGYFFPRTAISDFAMQNYYKFRFKEFYNLNDGKLNIYSGSLSKDGDDYYLFLVVAQSSYSSFIQYSLDLMKVSSLKTEKLVLSDDYMDKKINGSGKVVLDGLFFDNNSTVLSKDSQKALKTIAEFIKKRPKKKYMVVGHTDSVGGYEFNLKLSQGRAKSVMNALVNDYSLDKSKLKAVGISFASPAESNSKESGREENRRVELVEVNQF